MGSHLLEDEDYINMELSSSSPQIKDFEFQYFSTSTAHDSSAAAAAAAADLFYKGKLLPLHLPPRRQMLEHLLRTSTTTATTTTAAAAAFDQHFRHPPPPFLSISTAPCTNSNTPSDSCNISPSESCCDLNPNDKTLFEISSFFKNHHHQPTNNNYSWSKKLKMKMIKHSFLAQNKLKSSRAYLKSFFTKSHAENSSSSSLSSSRKGKKIATLIKKSNGIDDHRRSFSGAISADSTTNCLSSSSTSTSTSTPSLSSSSFNSRGLHELQILRRSSSAAEIEVSIDEAIDHCKKSMQNFGIDQL